MKKSTIPYTLSQLKKMYEKTKILDFDCPVQRRYGSWDLLKKSLLPHSMLIGFIVPPIYMTKEQSDKKNEKGKIISYYSCIDGQHRLRTMFDFLNDEFALDKETPDVEVDGEIYQIAGCKFSELPEDIREILSSYVFTIYNLEECTDEDIQEMFFRLNNGTGLSKTQLANVKLGMDTAKFLKTVLERDFFTKVCHFTPAQYRRAADEKTLLQAMMLLDEKDGDYNIISLSEGHIEKYAELLNNKYLDDKRKRLCKIIDYLEEGFKDEEKFMKVINIPMFIYMADEAIDSEIPSNDFYDWFKQFADNYTPDCAYAQYCGTGSVKKEKVYGRINILKADFDEYFPEEIEESEEHVSTDNVE